MSKAIRNAHLDPEVDYVRIYRDLATLDFPWDFIQSLSFALFRTYAVPSVGNLLHRTSEFDDRTQKRYDDTGILLEAPLLHGFEHERGRAAIRRINQMHKMYDITNEDMVYVLATFVVVPKRWMDDYGWRAFTDNEVRATVRYYQELGKHMAIRDIPETYDAFAELMDTYEAEHFAFDEGGRKVADATKDLLASFYPSPFRSAVDVFARSLMDDPLLEAFHYEKPNRIARALSIGAMKARAKFVAKLPARRRPKHVYEMSRIKSYPNGFVLEELGTFPSGCPVDRRAAAMGCPVNHTTTASTTREPSAEPAAS